MTSEAWQERLPKICECGGDRSFLRKMNMTVPAFLKLVWKNGDDDQRTIDAVKKSAGLA